MNIVDVSIKYFRVLIVLKKEYNYVWRNMHSRVELLHNICICTETCVIANSDRRDGKKGSR